MNVIRLLSLFVICIILSFCFNSDSGVAVTRDIAVVLKVKGEADLLSSKRSWSTLRRGARLKAGDKVRTGQESLVAVVFTDDKSMLKVRSDSEIEIGGKRTKKGFSKRLYMGLGHMWAKVNPKGAGFRLETPSGVAAVKGTTLAADVTLDKTEIKVLIGLVLASIGDIVEEVGAGQMATLEGGKITVVGMTEEQKRRLQEEWEELSEGEHELEIEYQDDAGNKKTLKIKYKE